MRVPARHALLALLLLPLGSRAAAENLSIVASNIIARDKEIWPACETPSGSVNTRDLFAYGLALGEARQHPERFDRLFELAERMQDLNPKSRTYGNFWWAMSDGRVKDPNAVEFSMRAAALIWLKHRDFVPAPARARLKRLLEASVLGCLNHKHAPSYSNIAIMNAGNLILLGEGLGKSDAADEGYARLDKFFHYTRAAGIHEFDSPGYYGIDLDGLGMIEAFCQRDSGRVQAGALLKFFWTDIALNWFPPAGKLAGAHSRTYDFLHGGGGLDRQVAVNGWRAAPISAEGVGDIFSVETRWRPPQSIRALSDEFPRCVRQSWGDEWWQSRTHYLLPGITLSCAASGPGGRMDMPLTADLPGRRDAVRCYFIADGRDDPYGQKKIADGMHPKVFHLNPFWTAAQRKSDALALAVYREKDIPEYATRLASNFVIPMEVDSFWIGASGVAFAPGKPIRLPVRPDEVVAFRKNDAALALRVPWSRALDGREAQTFLVYDGNEYGAVRLAVEHCAIGEKPKFTGTVAGTALWIRIGDGLSTDEKFSQWRQQFAAAEAQVAAKPDQIKLKVGGNGGMVSLAASAPWRQPEAVEPAPTRYALELNDKDIGSNILRSTHD